MSKLTNKQEAFILAYIGEARFNATKAARIAGYSEKRPSESGYALLQLSTVTARIQEELKARSLSADGVLAELTDIATADWHDFVKVRTNPKTGEEIDVTMDLGSKVKSLELLGKAHGVFTDRIDISGNLTSRVELVGVSEDDI